MDYIKRYNILVIFSVLVLICTMFFYPILIAQSALNGGIMWAKSVFPTLFPFFVCTNMLIDLGFAKFMGELLSPIMIPLFGVSGIGSFPLVSGMMSGYPVGAKITSDLYTNNKLNKKEAQRLLAFTNNCGPLFIIGVVGGVIFENVLVGYYILLIHILSAITYGIILNIFLGNVNQVLGKRKNFIREAFFQMRVHTSNNSKTFGQILSDSVEGAIKSSFAVLGFVVLFSVISTIIEIFHIHEILTYFINWITRINFSENVVESIFLGSIEMTAGLFLITKEITRINIIIAIFIVTFGGLSVHAQAISFISKTGLNGGRYILDKFFCGLISIFYGLVLLPFFKIIVSYFTNRVTLQVFLNNSHELNFLLDFRNIYVITGFIIFLSIVFFGIIFKAKK